MRHLAKIFMSVVFAACIVSCQKEDNEKNNGGSNIPGPELTGTMIDGTSLSSMGLYCLEKGVDNYGGMTWYEYYPKVKEVKGYEDIKLAIRFATDGLEEFAPEQKEDWPLLVTKYAELCAEKTAFILEDFNVNGKPNNLAWPELFSAYSKGQVTITCDKELFGLQPGTCLNRFFDIQGTSACLPVGIQSPTLLYGFGSEITKDVDVMFSEGAWLQGQEYWLEFNTIPSEEYADITLSLTFPITVEHLLNRAAAMLEGKTEGSFFSDKEFKADCVVRFVKLHV